MEFKGTRGDWEWIQNEYQIIIGADSRRNVLDTPTEEEKKANAQLIANAPKMLEMLIHLYKCSETGVRADYDEVYELIKEATKID